MKCSVGMGLKGESPPAILVVALLATLHSLAAGPKSDRVDFRIEDFLGRTWRNESVRFVLTAEQARQARAGRPLRGPGRKPIAYQFVPGADGRPGAIEFLVDLDPFEVRTYRFGDGEQKAPTDIVIEETDKLIRLSNSRTGIALPRRLVDGRGPIAAIRLGSGR